MNIKDLQTQGFVNLAYPPDISKAVQAVMASWEAFCSLPLSVAKQFPYSNGGAGVGFEAKEIKGKSLDSKYNFDISLAGASFLREQATSIGNETITTFVEDALALVDVVSPLIIGFARDVENEFDVKGFEEEIRESQKNFFIRFIRYPENADDGEETATSHVDQSGMTLHLGEDGPGFQGLTLDKKWIDIAFPEGETVIIPSMQLQLRSEGKLKAFCHRVVAKPETLHSGRISAVCFVQFAHTPKYDKDTHGRLQERAPGFNYDMSHEEFAKLFK